MPSVSKSQQRLLGAAYGYASNKTKNASPAVKKVVNSFMKKGRKGLKSLRHFAKTKHTGLPDIKESIIMKFSEFTNENINSDVVSYLYSLNDSNVNTCLNGLIRSKDDSERSDNIEDILIFIGDDIEEDKFHWVEKELNKIKNKK